eukprot:6615789-Pyramimonas_sp.AAC.1
MRNVRSVSTTACKMIACGRAAARAKARRGASSHPPPPFSGRHQIRRSCHLCPTFGNSHACARTHSIGSRGI